MTKEQVKAKIEEIISKDTRFKGATINISFTDKQVKKASANKYNRKH